MEKEKASTDKFYLQKVKSKKNMEVLPNPYEQKPAKFSQPTRKYDYQQASSKSPIKYNYPSSYA